jgi:hypothetical protein
LSSEALGNFDIVPELKGYYEKLGMAIPATILGGSQTVKTKNGTYSLIVEDSKGASDYFNSSSQKYVSNPAGRETTTLHEVFGHGRSLSVGRGDAHQHIDAISLENQVLRVMGHSTIQRDGTDHGTRVKISEPSKKPGY